jgi:hypothetical protein
MLNECGLLDECELTWSMRSFVRIIPIMVLSFGRAHLVEFSEFLVLENLQWWEAYTQGQRENGRTEHGCLQSDSKLRIQRSR